MRVVGKGVHLLANGPAKITQVILKSSDKVGCDLHTSTGRHKSVLVVIGTTTLFSWARPIILEKDETLLVELYSESAVLRVEVTCQ